ncbi:MAG: sialidase family protein [Acidobacteriota bacterium]
MRVRNWLITVLGMLELAFAGDLVAAGQPEGLDILVPSTKVGLSPSYGSIIELEDGRLLWAWSKPEGGEPLRVVQANVSTDGGRSWSDPAPMKLGNGQPLRGGAVSLVRLKSGSIGMAVAGTEELFFHVSRDEAGSWSAAVRVHPATSPVAFTNDRALVLETGRIVLPVYTVLEGPRLPVRKPEIKRYGAGFDGGWMHWMMYAYTLYSDDEGKTWQRSDNDVFITLDYGAGGIYSAQEPAVAELADGRLVMLFRTSLGHVYRSYSKDQGKTWLEAEPTALIGPPAAVSLRRIPGTNDLLAVWNQLSRFEVMQGLYRHRLSCAISSDGGLTWRNFKNLESLDDTVRVGDDPPGPVLYGPGRQPLDRKRYYRAPGPLRASYPTCLFVKGTAIVTYGLSTLGDKEIITATYGLSYDEVVRRLGLGPEVRANKVRAIPVEWFYEAGPSEGAGSPTTGSDR